MMEVDSLFSVKQAGKSMKTATVTEVGLDFPKVLKWVETGEEVQAVKGRQTRSGNFPHCAP